MRVRLFDVAGFRSLTGLNSVVAQVLCSFIYLSVYFLKGGGEWGGEKGVL